MTSRELATLRAALELWSDRNVPADRAQWELRRIEHDLIATGGRKFPALDAEECDALAAKLREDDGTDASFQFQHLPDSSSGLQP